MLTRTDPQGLTSRRRVLSSPCSAVETWSCSLFIQVFLWYFWIIVIMIKAICHVWVFVFFSLIKTLPSLIHVTSTTICGFSSRLFSLFLPFCHRILLAWLFSSTVDESSHPIWCPWAGSYFRALPNLWHLLLLNSLLSPNLVLQINSGTAVCLPTIKSCTMEIWRRVLRARCLTTLYRTNVSTC